MRRASWLVLGLALGAAQLPAQAVPENSQAARVDRGYRRTPTFRIDPFRHAMIPHWGFVISAGGSGENNTVNLADARALLFLSDSTNNPDGILAGDILDVLALVPEGRGITGRAQGEGGFYLGGPFGGHFSLGLSAQGRGYGAFQVDDSLVALARDGNGTQQNFGLGNTGGVALGTAEGGAHAVLRFGPLGSEDGVHLNLGFGARYIKAVAFARFRSMPASAGVIQVTADSIVADLEIERAYTPDIDSTLNGKASIAADFLLRLTWPTSGFALEAMLANVGSVTIHYVETERRRLNVRTNNLQEVLDSLDNFGNDTLAVKDTVDLKVKLPRIVRFTASAWANRILQVDVSATLPVTGDFEQPMAVDIGTTWRFIRVLPLRAGLVLGGHQGLGFTGGFALEGRNTFLQVSGQTLGGLFRRATGAGARVELGLFF